MTRILDIDLDFFVDGAEYWKPSDSQRLDAKNYPPWTREKALGFFEEQLQADGEGAWVRC